MKRKPNVVNDFYNNKKEKTVDERKESKIIGLRSFNNYVKAKLLNQVMFKDCTILDLCCGRGGDLKKFNGKRVVCVDRAEKSVDDLKFRFLEMRNPSFTLNALVKNCHEPFIDDLKEEEFDVVSCQFALHYATGENLKVLLYNATKKLKVGGHFVFTIPDYLAIAARLDKGTSLKNDIFSLEFKETDVERLRQELKEGGSPEYVFTLTDAVESCPEYIVNVEKISIPGLKLISQRNFDEWYDLSTNDSLFYQMKCRALSHDELEVIGLYKTVVFKKIF